MALGEVLDDEDEDEVALMDGELLLAFPTAEPSSVACLCFDLVEAAVSPCSLFLCRIVVMVVSEMDRLKALLGGKGRAGIILVVFGSESVAAGAVFGCTDESAVAAVVFGIESSLLFDFLLLGSTRSSSGSSFRFRSVSLLLLAETLALFNESLRLW